MAETPTIHVSRMLDERGISAFQINLLVWSFFMVLIDGYDIGAVSFALPSLIKDWGISPRDAGPVLTASIVGMLFGSAIFGFVGDRYGRKTAVLSANLLFGIITYFSAYATSLNELALLRLIAGLGIGGIIPNIIALNAESAPRRLRGTMAMIAIGLVPIGGAVAGLIAATLVPTNGWQILFYIGGVVPVLIAVCGFFAVPESVKFMALHERYRPALVRAIHCLRPDLTVPANAKFVVEDERNFRNFNPSHLFRNGLGVITPLLWLIFALNLIGYYFLAGWTPTLLVTAAHLPPQIGAFAGVMMQVGGTVGPLLLCRWLDKQRFLAVTILFVLAVPIVGSLGWFGITSQVSLMIAAFLVGFMVLSIQTGLNVTGALIYPTSLRANGSGWELGIGRLSSIIGPLLGALFVSLPVQDLYMWAAIPSAVGAVACFVVYRLDQARTRSGASLNDAESAAAE